jgi:hypothetical protein
MTSASDIGDAAAGDWRGANPTLRSSLSFASCYIYAPRGAGLLSAGSRLLCQRVKASDPHWLPRYAGQVAELCTRERVFERLFARDACLIPIPGCSPACAMSTAACQLAMAFHALGLAHEVWPAIARRVAVTRSATALLGKRPTVRQHYESFAVGKARGPAPHRIVLIDDVITKGRTLLAAAARLRCEFPHADIRAFALVRTLGFLGRVDRLLAPCEGVVYWAGGDARREP